MKTEVRMITPTIAKEMLKRNSNNRKLKEQHCLNLSKAMLAGEWVFDGQPVRFSEGGTLLDGQHRLSAIILSGTTQEFLIITGIKSEAFHVMDTGRLRNGADILGMEGADYSSATSAAIGFILNHKRGKNGEIGGSSKITNSSILSYYRENKSLKGIMTKSHSYYMAFSKVLPHSQVAAYLLLMGEKNVIDAELFWSKMGSGLGLEAGSPELTLRKKLISDKISKSSLAPSEKKALIIKAWNAFRQNKKVTVLRWNKETEKFPVIL